jgi:hypothetical protein
MPRRDVTKNFVRDRQLSPKACAPGSFRTIKTGKKLRVVCCPKGKLKRNGRCKVGMKVQTVLTPR